MQSGLVIEHIKRFSESRYSVGIYVNGEFIVNTLNKKRHEIELKPGRYVIRVESGYRSGETVIEIKSGKITEYHFSASPRIYVSYVLSVIAFLLMKEDLFFPGLACFAGGLILVYGSRKEYYQLKKISEDEYWQRLE